MAELLSAGVFIEEVPSSSNVTSGVSTTTMGILGWTPEGPTDTATLVTSFEQFVKTFGSFDRRSYLAYSMFAFFSNGGRRCYVVRVLPSDAVAANCKVQSQTTAQVVEEGDGSTAAFSQTASTSVVKDNDSSSPIVPESFTISWRGKASQSSGVAVKKRNGTTSLTTATGVLAYEGRINPATLPDVEPGLLCVVPEGSTTISWLCSAVSKSVTISAPTSGTVGTGTNGADSTAVLDFKTGFFSLLMDVAETPDDAEPVLGTYYPATDTYTVTDDGAGVLPAGSVLTGAGALDYDTGAYNFTTNATVYIPHDGGNVVATYKIYSWTFNPISSGEWANDLKVTIKGSPNYYTASTNSYSRFDIQIKRTDPNSNLDIIQELYEEMVMDDDTSTFYFADIINEFSKLVTVEEPGGLEAPGQLNGIGRTQVLAGGNDIDASRLVQTTLLEAPLSKRSLTITYTTTAGDAKSITDDGKGNLIGDVDTTYTGDDANTVNYTTGVVDFKTLEDSIKAGTLVTATFRSSVTETAHTESFGDEDSDYIVGEDGTFDSNSFGRAQYTSPALAEDYRGLYALDRIDEIMQVVVPDFAGDLTVTGDLLDYAVMRSNSPSGGDRYIILTVPKGSTATDAVDWFRTELGRFSDYAALYWPWVNIADPLTSGRKLTIPVLGHIAGIYARTDITKNVGKSPGGTVDGALAFVQSLETSPTQGERDVVYSNKINPLISSPQTGLAVWGVRSISLQSQWRYINSRRLFMFLEKSIYNSTFWIVFENNGPALWAKIAAQMNSFLLGLFNDGLFAGSSPAQAFFVTVDSTNNSASSIDSGQVVVDIGVAVNKPAEFVRFRLSQKSLT